MGTSSGNHSGTTHERGGSPAALSIESREPRQDGNQIPAWYDPKVELICQQSGHVLCRCPACGDYRLCSYRPPSQTWPVCHTCAPGHLAGAKGRFPRLVPVDPDYRERTRKNPGEPRTRKQLIEDGYRPKPDSTEEPEPL